MRREEILGCLDISDYIDKLDPAQPLELTEPDREGERVPDNTIHLSIPQNQLPRYRQTAQISGFGLEVIAQPRERFFRWLMVDDKWHEVEEEVKEGRVAIAIKRPDSIAAEKGFTHFWETIKAEIL